MKITAHCFAYNVKINPPRQHFKYKDMEVSLTPHTHDGKSEIMLQITKDVNPETLEVVKEERDDQGRFIEARMRPYKEILAEVSQMLEGFFTLSYLAPPPKFETDRIIVNVSPENLQEQKLIDDGKITGGFGNIARPPQYFEFHWNERFIPAIPESIKHIPALAFLTQAVRSQADNNQEIAFFLYFRIIEGYFSDGSKEVEKALLKESDNLSRYLKYEEDLKDAITKVLSDLGLPSKCKTNFSGLISDLVLIRHKLTHFSETNSHRHHKISVQVELRTINLYLRQATTILLIDRIGLK